MNSITQESLELMKGALAQPDFRLAKSISTATGLLAFDLQAPAKNLYPFVTPLRNIVPRVGGGVGSATNWRQVNAIIGSGFDCMGWVPEGQRSGQMSYSTSNKTSAFVTIGEEDAATFEAISAGRTFEDIQAMMAFRLLQKMMLKEEMAILAGNASLTLGTPSTPTLSASGAGATLPAATYFVKVVALTLEGYQNTSALGGVATSKTVIGADERASRCPVAPRTLVPRQAKRWHSVRRCSAQSTRSRARSRMLGMCRPRAAARRCRPSRPSTV
jgi:hypothetical protein